MSTYPTAARAPFVEWCDAQRGVFIEAADTIGLTESQVAEFAATTEKARALLVEQQMARQRLDVATQKVQDIVRQLRSQAGDAVRSIRAHAELTADPAKVYAAARIAPPAGPSPMPPPGQPKRLSATLEAASGALTLRWKARHPSGVAGTTYLVRRRLPGEAGFSFLGTAGKKSFVDETLPAGTPSVQYSVQAQRGRRTGESSEILTVNIGKSAAPDTAPDGARDAARVSARSKPLRASDQSRARQEAVPA